MSKQISSHYLTIIVGDPEFQYNEQLLMYCLQINLIALQWDKTQYVTAMLAAIDRIKLYWMIMIMTRQCLLLMLDVF